ncbi:DUF2306 domain-containing protein [Neolewinella antarctica]|uniref:DUF2306 domain-containing protein n=1 Tax=Neolewinella antarctica TaxID=442734 RepID=A0ABX0XIA2_9BACT|nr:DUF2306 domain-containing protein [Neolewinella antarctica]NJC28488.1 hypothetical protein [Neolewinella antarctica]
MNLTARSATIITASTDPSNKLLRWAAIGWFVVAIIGQLLFAVYIVGFYGGTAVYGNIAEWNEKITHGFSEGATVSNLVVGIHLFFAALITLGGPVQLISGIKRKYPVFHRRNGRIYVMLTAIAALTGLYMLYAHEGAGGAVSRPAMTLEAVLILLAGVLVWRFAVARQFRRHEAWAVRLFLVASGVWFFRVILMGWMLVNGGAVGFDPETFTGPFLDFLSYAHYLLPLAVYELYLWAGRSSHASVRYAVVGLLVVCTVFTGVGIFGAVAGLWLPAFS